MVATLEEGGEGERAKGREGEEEEEEGGEGEEGEAEGGEEGEEGGWGEERAILSPSLTPSPLVAPQSRLPGLQRLQCCEECVDCLCLQHNSSNLSISSIFHNTHLIRSSTTTDTVLRHFFFDYL